MAKELWAVKSSTGPPFSQVLPGGGRTSALPVQMNSVAGALSHEIEPRSSLKLSAVIVGGYRCDVGNAGVAVAHILAVVLFPCACNGPGRIPLRRGTADRELAYRNEVVVVVVGPPILGLGPHVR